MYWCLTLHMWQNFWKRVGGEAETVRLFAPRACSEVSWSFPAYTNRDWLFWLRRWCCIEPRAFWLLAPSSHSIKNDDICRTEIPHSRARTACPDWCFEKVETLLVWNVNNSLHWSFFSCYLANQSGTLSEESSLERALLWVSCQAFLPEGSAEHWADALSRREDCRPTNSLSTSENKDMTDTTRKAYDKDDLFRDIDAYIWDAERFL
jgi:hypothetical protein